MYTVSPNNPIRGRINPPKPNVELRIKMVKAMEFIVSHVNNEDFTESWLSLGVADGDIKFGDLSVQLPQDSEELYPYYEDDNNFAQLMNLFTQIMSHAHKDGGLYCDRVVSEGGNW